jgi:hypothetical protein
MHLILGVLLAQAVYWVYPAPGVIANGPAPVFANAEDAARCEDALWIDEKGLPDKTVPESRYRPARAVCDKAEASLEPGVSVIVEGQFMLKSSPLAAFRVQGLVVRPSTNSQGSYAGVEDFWIPANRVQVSTSQVTTQTEQEALWRRLTGKP